MLKEREDVIRKAIVIFDALVVSVSFFLSVIIRRSFHDFYTIDIFPFFTVVADIPNLSVSDYTAILLLSVPVWCIVLHLNGMYRSMRTRTLPEIIFIIIKSAFLVVLALATAAFLFKLKFLSRAFFLIFVMLTSTALAIEKIAIYIVTHQIRKRGYNYKNLLIIGTGPRSCYFINKIRNHPEWGLRIEGLIEYEEGHLGREVAGLTVIGMLKDIPRILDEKSIDEVVFIVPRSKLSLIENSLYACETVGVKTTVTVDLFDLRIASVHASELEDIPLITFETTVATEWQLFIKKSVDIIASGLGLIILSPLFLIVVILIKLTSKGPILFKQKRVGLNGRKFILYKFRSMYKDAHLKQKELMGFNEMTGPVFKIKKDPRITPLGWVLRKFSIDELPQLFNVFIGDLSLVGPRPLPVYEVAKFEPWQKRRLSMRPGLTCIWQISGRNKIGFEEWMKLDLQYIDEWSLGLDFKILCKTVPVVLFGIGAY